MNPKTKLQNHLTILLEMSKRLINIEFYSSKIIFSKNSCKTYKYWSGNRVSKLFVYLT